jgi:hypothetical protein
LLAYLEPYLSPAITGKIVKPLHHPHLRWSACRGFLLLFLLLLLLLQSLFFSSLLQPLLV